jgi:hypothetical protein
MLCCILLCSAPQAANGAIAEKTLLYADNFSTSKNSIFGSYSDNTSNNYFENGKYRITVFPMNFSSAYQSGAKCSDIALEVEATQVSGPDDNGYRVIFRLYDWENYYYFLISGDGYYQIAKLMNNSWSARMMNNSWSTSLTDKTWSPIYWIKSSAIHTENATNRINVTCDENKFSFYINDQKINEFMDNNSYPGGIGLMARTENTPGAVTIDFDNLRVWGISR